MTAVTVRPEMAGDEPAIHALNQAAFRDMKFSEGTEGPIIDELRRSGKLTLSLVATRIDEAIIGHIAFSPITISDGTPGWYALGPVSVIPLKQSNGIGSALVERGIADMRAMGANGLALLGDPKYYRRFGFEVDPDLVYPGAPAEYFMSLKFDGPAPSGEVTYPAAFSVEL